MRRLGGIGIAWIAATAVAVTIAAAAVGSVRSEVADSPTALGISISPSLTLANGEPPETTRSIPESVEALPKSTTTLPPADTADLSRLQKAIAFGSVSTAPSKPAHVVKSLPHGVSTTTSTLPPAATTTTNLAPSTPQPDKPTPRATTTTTTTAPTTTTTAPTTTTTVPDPPVDEKPYTRLIDTDGGSIAVSVDGDDVLFRRGFASQGWRLRIINRGPEVVEVVFHSNLDRNVTITVEATVIGGKFVYSVVTSG